MPHLYTQLKKGQRNKENITAFSQAFGKKNGL